MVAFRELEQPQEVDDLVVAPVADVGPGVVGIEHLPVETGTQEGVGVVPVSRRFIADLEDHALDAAGKRERQRLPILEDVTPVALVVEDPLAMLSLDLDGDRKSTRL